MNASKLRTYILNKACSQIVNEVTGRVYSATQKRVWDRVFYSVKAVNSSIKIQEKRIK